MTEKTIPDLQEFAGKTPRYLNKLSCKEKKIILECLKAAAFGPFFSEEMLYTVIGVKKSEILEVIKKWPNINIKKQKIYHLIYVVFWNMIFFPNGFNDNLPDYVWNNYISVPYEKASEIFYKFTGEKKTESQKWDGFYKYFPKNMG